MTLCRRIRRIRRSACTARGSSFMYPQTLTGNSSKGKPRVQSAAIPKGVLPPHPFPQTRLGLRHGLRQRVEREAHGKRDSAKPALVWERKTAYARAYHL